MEPASLMTSLTAQVEPAQVSGNQMRTSQVTPYTDKQSDFL